MTGQNVKVGMMNLNGQKPMNLNGQKPMNNPTESGREDSKSAKKRKNGKEKGGNVTGRKDV